VWLALSAMAWAQAGPVQPATVEGSVHSIQLPNFNPDLPPAPQPNLFLNRCTVCHSARYVLMQFPLSRTVWTAEVAKMRKAYGCVVPEADREKLVDYLMEIRGARP
jgi:hypothetical protein